MTATIEIPDGLAALMVDSFSSPSRAVLEAVAADAHRRGCITAFQVGQLLGHASRWETREFLAGRHALRELTAEEILHNAATLDTFLQRE